MSFLEVCHSGPSRLLMEKLVDLKTWQAQQEEKLRSLQKEQEIAIEQQKRKIAALQETAPVNNNSNSLEIFKRNFVDFDSSFDRSDVSNLSIIPEDPEECSLEDRVSSEVEEEGEGTNKSENILPLDLENEGCKPIHQVTSSLDIDSSPVTPAIDGCRIKSFEDYVTLKLNESICNNDSKPNKPVAKRPFLKKGSGLARFQLNMLGINENKVPKIYKKPNTVKKKVFNKKSSASPPITKVYDCQRQKRSPPKLNLKPRPDTTVQRMNHPKSIQIQSTKALPKRKVEITRHNIDEKSGAKENVREELALFELLEQVSDSNVSFDSNSSIVNEFTKLPFVRGKDHNSSVENMQKLLEKINNKKMDLERKIYSNEDDWLDLADSSVPNKLQKKPKSSKMGSHKKVRWSVPHVNNNKKHEKHEGYINNNFENPIDSEYSNALKSQIKSLESKLKDLQLKSKEKPSSVTSKDNFKQIEFFECKLKRLNERIINLEAKQIPEVLPKNRASLPSSKRLTNAFVERNATNFKNEFQDIGKKAVHFFNGDTMKVIDDVVEYTYSNGTQQTVYPDGRKLIKFSNGQVEQVLPNGKKEITYSNGIKRTILPTGSEEIQMPDGTSLRLTSEGTEVLEMSNGDREIRTSSYKRREYKNGIVKTIHEDGTQETRYPNGRLRIKDNAGTLIFDSKLRHINNQ